MACDLIASHNGNNSGKILKEESGKMSELYTFVYQAGSGGSDHSMRTNVSKLWIRLNYING